MRDHEPLELLKGLFHGISQVLWLEDVACGGIILVGIFLSSPISAGFTLLGSAISLLTCMSLGVDPKNVYSGAYSQTSILSIIAVGGMFFQANSGKLLAYATMAAMFSVIVYAGLSNFLYPMGLPPLDFAFNIVCWVWCLAGNQSKGLFPVDVTAITVPEDHIKRVKLVKCMTS